MSQDPTPGAAEPQEPVASTPAAESVAPAPAAEPVAPAPAPAPAAAAAPAAPPSAPAPAPQPEPALDAYVVPAGTVVVDGPSLVGRLGAELFGTFFLVLAGLGVALYAGLGAIGGGSGLAVALAFGIAVIGGAAAVGHISGGHFNPAVTLGAAIAGRTSWRDVLPYWLVQLVGGALGAAVVFIAVPSALPALVVQEDPSVRSFFSGLANGYGEHSPLSTASTNQAEFSLFAAILVELVVTAVFVGVILGVTDRRADSKIAPIVIGLTLTALILVAMPVTNASLNPARSLAAAIFAESWAWKQLWVFFVGPLLGAALAGIVYRAFAAEPPEQDNLLEEDDVYVTQEDVVVVEERTA
ncbi:MIP family channel protein [Cellulomonas sp. DKR-3]|uniref:MIP family channel protein n=1 Tax=Cellulomonas fulva TaxID=2835530 RepID=A0ABS5TZ45_9CELL|nr:MIP family channel protein [Cellulomonas fulva]MBT0994423.1 MIP family channel protein [Cellulomonas fulva]